RYKFSYYDSIIVSSALLSGCQVLYSEDMQHSLLVENQLTIIDPFVQC
ncbi:MAG: twitching motility protein PilT, partial [Thiothrix lacustris]